MMLTVVSEVTKGSSNLERVFKELCLEYCA